VVNTSPLQYLFSINQGLISAVKPLITDLIAARFWLSAKVQQEILQLAGE
jgi:predicted nucleic acid-binding protein